MTTPHETPERLLVRALRERWDAADAAVLADWCEERGILATAEALRGGEGTLAWKHLLCLAFVIGELATLNIISPAPQTWPSAFLASMPIEGRSTFLGFPEDLLAPGDFITLDLMISVRSRVRRLVFAESCADQLVVHALMLGINSLIVDPVPARIFDDWDLGMNAPILEPNARIRLGVQNVSDQPVRLRVGAVCEAFE